MWIITFASVKRGKRFAMNLGLAFTLLGTMSLYFTLTPKYPYLQLVSAVIAGLGLQGCWLMVCSMTADVCDEDELNTGLRREGVYGSAYGFVQKLALGIAAFTSGLVLNLAGFEVKSAEATGSISIGIINNMKWMLIGIQCVGLATAMVMFMFYPLTKKRADEIREILAKKHEEKDKGQTPA